MRCICRRTFYTRRGMWRESIDFNRRSAEAALKLAQAAGTLNSHFPHALDYLAYAYLQRGQYAEAAQLRAQIPSLRGPYDAGALTQIGFAFAAIPARSALERQAWKEAADLPLRQPETFPWGKRFLNCDSITHFARAIGAVRSGQLDAARAELVHQERVFEELRAGQGPPYWVAQAETQLLATQAWLEFASKNTDSAIGLMRRAVELEASTDKEAVTPGEVLPAGELLGDLLDEADRHDEALAAFEAVLAASPNRLNALFGAGRAAERGGDLAKARSYYRQLVAQTTEADASIPRIEHARAFLRRLAGGADR